MPMHNFGLTKLQEECGELVQASAKLASMIEHSLYFDDANQPKLRWSYSYVHHDGHNLKAALEDEVADVRAATLFVMTKHSLDSNRIRDRTVEKLALFEKWDRESVGEA